MPLYSLFLWLCNSHTISGRVYFKLISEHNRETDEEQDNDDNDNDHRQLQQQDDNNHQLLGNNHHPYHHQLNRQTPIVVLLCTERVTLFQIISSRYDDNILQSLYASRQTTTMITKNTNNKNNGNATKSELKWNEFFHAILTGELLHQNISIGLSLLLFICYLLVLIYYTYHSVST